MGGSKKKGKTTKMDGLFHGKPYEQMDDLGGVPSIFGRPPISQSLSPTSSLPHLALNLPIC